MKNSTIAKEQTWDLHSYNIFLSETINISPFSMTTYDIVQGAETISKTISGREHEGFSTKFSTYKKWLKSQKKKKSTYTRRIAQAVKKGAKTLEEARGHKEELLTETRTEEIPREYDSSPLFVMQKWFEYIVEKHLKWNFDPAQKNELFSEQNIEHDEQNRQFEWKFFDDRGTLRYFIQYQQGKIKNISVWGRATKSGQFSEDRFPREEFEEKIRSLGVWE